MYLKYSRTEEEQKKWQNLYKLSYCSNLLQSPFYGWALKSYMAQIPQWVFIEIEGKTAGIVQIMEVGMLGNLMHGVIVDRGPLWLEGYGCKEHQKKFWLALNKKYPRRWGRKRRFIPEMLDSQEVTELLQECDLKKNHHIKSYETIRLDLRQGFEALRNGFKKNWRGALSKSERSNLDLKWNDGLRYFSAFMNGYKRDKNLRGYGGASPRLLHALSKTFGSQKAMIIGIAELENKIIASILIICHGRSATYQAGWTTEEGRKLNAHHYLLWDLLRILKARHVYDLDLGGVNEETHGIRKFKEGMGGEKIRLVGAYY